MGVIRPEADVFLHEFGFAGANPLRKDEINKHSTRWLFWPLTRSGCFVSAGRLQNVRIRTS
jgi:hypothetical protein